MSRTLLSFFLMFVPLTLAQQPGAGPADTPQKNNAVGRPRIGLVLEGGGALGLAHLGVLQWFEQHHVPVDAIVGTSMAPWWVRYMRPACRAPRCATSSITWTGISHCASGSRTRIFPSGARRISANIPTLWSS